MPDSTMPDSTTTHRTASHRTATHPTGTDPTGTESPSTSRRLGLVVFGLLSLADIATLALTDGQSPPYAVAALVALLGVVSLVLVVQAYRDAAREVRLLIGLRVLSAVAALPAFFVDAPAGAQVAAAGIVVLTAVGVVLTARGSRPAVAS